MMQTCGACCENALMNPSEYASMVCNGAHLVLWARFIDSRYWPSKLMTIDGSDVKVWFFGHHSFADVSRTDCLRYSAERPETNENTGDTDKFADALKVHIFVYSLFFYSFFLWKFLRIFFGKAHKIE